MRWSACVLIFAGSLGGYVACGGRADRSPGHPVEASGGASGGLLGHGGAGDTASGTSTSGGSLEAGEPSVTGGGGGAASGAGGGAGESDGGMISAGGAGGAGGTASRSLELLDELATAICQNPCGDFGRPMPDCKARVTEWAQVDALSSGRLAFNEAKVEECLLTLAALQSDDCDMALPVGVCTQLYLGTRSIGQSCNEGRECRQSGEGVACVTLAGSDDRACRPIVPVQHGETCVGTCTTDCAEEASTSMDGPLPFCRWRDGLYCNPSQGSCQRFAQQGQFCFDSEACGDVDSCDYDPDYVPDTYCYFSLAECASVSCDADPACRHDFCSSHPGGTVLDWVRRF